MTSTMDSSLPRPRSNRIFENWQTECKGARIRTMHHNYNDIRSRIPEAPTWFDQFGVPRYGAFSPDQSPNIYADQVCLVEVVCQQCNGRFQVQFSSAEELGPVSLEKSIRDRNLRYGDPPNHSCVGDTMNSIPLRVIEFWRRPIGADTAFRRVSELEIDIKPEWEKGDHEDESEV
jgi:hypothetical protein